MARFFRKPEAKWFVPSVLAAVIMLGALIFPLWRLELVAPQYPAGLVIHAFGNRFADDPGTYYDDVREINGLNHYIGMKPMSTVTEMQLFIPGVSLLIIGSVLSGFIAFQQKWLKRLIVAGYWFIPAFFILDLQYWLWKYGHTMNPEAALNTGDFTPRIIGTTKVWNFHSETSFALGFYCMIAAALVVTFGPWVYERVARLVRGRAPGTTARSAAQTGTRVAAIALVAGTALAGVMAWDGGEARAQDGQPSLQARIDAAAPQDIIVVEGGTHGPVRIDKPISLVGHGWPVIDGGGTGDVVTIASDDVVVSGFELRGSGKAVSQEPAALKLDGFDRATITGNRIRDSYFGIHMTASDGTMIGQNDIRAGEGVPQERRGHGIYLWKVNGSTVTENAVQDAADGIHLEFAEDNIIVGNEVHDSRYGLHFMYAHGNTVASNTLTHNLSGAVLMFSHELVVKDNEFSNNRAGATGAGMLLKDNDNLFAEGNRMLRNKYGMTVEGTPQSAGTTAIFRRNLFALNDTGIALTSNSPITFVENAVIDNTVQVKAMSANAAASLGAHGPASTGAATDEGGAASQHAVWSSNGRGNYWSDYQGFDGNGDGVGDPAYRPQPPFAGRLGNDETLRLFQYTLAQQAIDLAADMFPVYRYDAVIEDPHPLMSPPDGLGLAGSERFNPALLIASGGLVALAALAAFWAGAPIPRRAARGAAAASAA